MTTLGYNFGTSSLKAGLSAGTLSLVQFYQGKTKMNSSMLKKAGFQFLSSISANTVEAFIRPYLPMGAQISSTYIKPLIVGTLFTVMCKVIDGSKSYMSNFILSVGSEVGGSYLESPVDKLLYPSSVSTSGANSVSYQGSGGASSRTLG